MLVSEPAVLQSSHTQSGLNQSRSQIATSPRHDTTQRCVLRAKRSALVGRHRRRNQKSAAAEASKRERNNAAAKVRSARHDRRVSRVRGLVIACARRDNAERAQ
jgi:hypothetical protein